jgi:hypothetical protein
MNKQITLMMVTITLMMVILVSADLQTLGTKQQGQAINLIQNCINSTYSNISRITYPNGTFAINSQTLMTKNIDDYNYTFTNTQMLEQYIVYGVCDENGIKTNWVYDFWITGNGKDKPEGIVIVLFSFFFLVIVGFLVYTLIYSMGHLLRLDFDIMDLAYNLGMYFVLFALYMLSLFYLGNPQIEDFLLLLIQIGAITHVFIPFIAFVLNLTIGQMTRKKLNTPTGNGLLRRRK